MSVENKIDSAKSLSGVCPICLDPLDLEVQGVAQSIIVNMRADQIVFHPDANGEKHPMHEHCAESWFYDNASCPVCRHPVESMSGISLGLLQSVSRLTRSILNYAQQGAWSEVLKCNSLLKNLNRTLGDLPTFCVDFASKQEVVELAILGRQWDVVTCVADGDLALLSRLSIDVRKELLNDVVENDGWAYVPALLASSFSEYSQDVLGHAFVFALEDQQFDVVLLLLNKGFRLNYEQIRSLFEEFGKANRADLVELFYEWPSKIPDELCVSLVCGAAKSGHVSLVEKYLGNRVISSDALSSVFITAAFNNQQAILVYLLNTRGSDISAEMRESAARAARSANHIETYQILTKKEGL